MKKMIIMAVAACIMAAAPSDGFARKRVVKHVHKVKHGMSHKTKGALIGAGGGAIIGGVAHGGKGAVIGGAAGAGLGYLIGRHEDKAHPQRKTVVVDKTVVRRK